MSVTFTAWNPTTSEFVSTPASEFDMSNASAGQLLIALGLDTAEEIQARGLVAGEMPAGMVIGAIDSVPAISDSFLANRARHLLALAEFARGAGAEVHWA